MAYLRNHRKSGKCKQTTTKRQSYKEREALARNAVNDSKIARIHPQ